MSYDSSAFCLSSFLADPNGKDMEGLEIENLISQATNANSQMGDPCSACDASTHGGGRAQKFPAHNVKALVGGNGCVDLPMPETSPPTVTNPPPTAPAATTSVGASLVALGAVSSPVHFRQGLEAASSDFDRHGMEASLASSLSPQLPEMLRGQEPAERLGWVWCWQTSLL
jgi:hypothetical protein